MPNGKGFAQCGECINFIPGDKPHCKKHNFDFPLIVIGYEILCRDYAPAYSYSEKTRDEIKSLEIGYLFYYCCQGERNYKQLGRFTDFKYPLYGVHLLEDKSYKWLFEVKDYYKGLWDKDSITLRYENKNENFIKVNLNKEMFTSYTVATKNISYSPKGIIAFVPQDRNSDFLNSFIESFLGLKEYQNRKRSRKEALVFGISIFLEEHENSIYRVIPDLHFKDFFAKI